MPAARTVGLAVLGLVALGGMFAACGSSTDAAPATTGGTSAASSGMGGASTSSSSSASSTSSTSSSSSGAGGHGGQGGAGVGGAGGGASCAPLADDCSKCVFSTCNDLYCACEANADCIGTVLCVLPCKDNGCVQACYLAHPAGIAQTTLIAACADKSCGVECPLANNAGVCEVCAANKCPAEVNACFGDVDCAAIIQCIRNSCAKGDTICQQQCATAHPKGIFKAEALRNCVGTNCAIDCTNF